MTDARPEGSEPERWLEFARDDFGHGEAGLAAHVRPAAWSFQQAGEKALKAMLRFIRYGSRSLDEGSLMAASMLKMLKSGK